MSPRIEEARTLYRRTQQGQVDWKVQSSRKKPKPLPLHPVIHCEICLNLPEDYMVKEGVWAQAIKATEEGQTRFLCLSCLEHRLERKLVLSDFTLAQCNSGILLGFRMALDMVEKKNV